MFALHWIVTHREHRNGECSSVQTQLEVWVGGLRLTTAVANRGKIVLVDHEAYAC